MSIDMQAVPLVPDVSLRWGAALRAARVAQQLTLASVAMRLKLTEAQVDAIEHENMAGVHPSAVFARGYVRNYAQLLGLVLAADSLESMSAEQGLHSINHVNTYFTRHVRSGKKKWWLFVVFLLAVLVWQFVADAQLMVLLTP